MRDKMRKWREENSRNSEQIVEVGEELINEYASKLGDDSKFFYSCSVHVLFWSLGLFLFFRYLFIMFFLLFISIYDLSLLLKKLLRISNGTLF